MTKLNLDKYDIPYVVKEDVIDVGDFKLKVSTLNNGQRVIDQEDLETFLVCMGSMAACTFLEKIPSY